MIKYTPFVRGMSRTATASRCSVGESLQEHAPPLAGPSGVPKWGGFGYSGKGKGATKPLHLPHSLALLRAALSPVLPEAFRLTRQLALTTPPHSAARSLPRDLIWLLAAGALLRLVLVLIAPPRLEGGDSIWILETGLRLVQGTEPVIPTTPPLYLFYVGIIQALTGSQAAAVAAIRLLNAAWGAALIGAVYVAADAYFGRRTAQTAGWLVALSPIFIVEAGSVLTESLFLPFVMGAIAVYAQSTSDGGRLTRRNAVLIGLLLGLAALTRAVGLALPVIFLLHMTGRYRWGGRGPMAVLAAAYMLTLLTWTAYGYARWGVFRIGGEGLLANIYLGTNEGWCGPECIDQRAGITAENSNPQNNNQAYLQRTLETLANDLAGYAARRLTNLAEATLQPHNTVFFGGPSIKEAFAGWWAGGRTWDGLIALTQTEAFWPKLTLYIFHYGALILGGIGLLIGMFGRRMFWAAFPLYALIGYFFGIHLVMTAIPRYLFPTLPTWCIFAALTFASLRRKAA